MLTMYQTNENKELDFIRHKISWKLFCNIKIKSIIITFSLDPSFSWQFQTDAAHRN